MIKRKLDIIVIGGGAAGLAAAIAAKESGVNSVLVLERNPELGGILPQCIHTGFGLHYFKENLTGPEYISRFISRVHDLEIEYKVETMVLELSPRREVWAVNQHDGLLNLKADAIVLAMGCRERSRGALCIPGTRPAGIFTAGTAQRLMDIEGFIPGRKVLILGSGDVGLIMARRFAMEGAEVMGVVEVAPYPGGLDRNLQCLRDFGIPLYLRHAATFIHGSDRVEAVTISRLDESGKPIAGEEKTIECDTLILSVGLIPENELSKGAGIQLDPNTGGPVVDENMETSIEGVFACGNVVHVHDLVDHVTQSGEAAGKNAAKKVLGELPPLERRIHLRPEGNIRYVVPQIISGERPLTLFSRVKKPASNAKIIVGEEISIHKRIVKPPELVTIKLTSKLLKKLNPEKKELTVTMEE
ncbi:pyridine nucleotide-disulfide oxidoreductase [Candidatus Bathyarchaeota archaeon]|nr:MAG: pyridine nucleotide-disulfide oxidoreductase [Candidatus Bathyarchaeota archaeon]